MQENNVDRRSLFVRAIYGLWAVIGASLAAPALVYLFFPPKARKAEEWVEVADAGQLSLKSPEEVVFRHNRIDGWKVNSEKATAWVVKMSDNEFVAFAPQCTHLGCAYRWDEQKQSFLCPCHTSTFSMDGRVLSGPAPRPLVRFEVKVEKGKLKIGPFEKAQEHV